MFEFIYSIYGIYLRFLTLIVGNISSRRHTPLAKVSETEVMKLRLIPKKQFSFQRAHSTIHQLGRVIDGVSEAMSRRHTMALLLLDSEKAFDSVWIEGLVYKLMTYNLPNSYCKHIYSYLTDRRMPGQRNFTKRKVEYRRALYSLQSSETSTSWTWCQTYPLT